MKRGPLSIVYLATGPFDGMCAAQPLAVCASGKSLSKCHPAFPVGEYVAIAVRLDNVFGHAVAVSDKFVHGCDIGILVVSA